MMSWPVLAVVDNWKTICPPLVVREFIVSVPTLLVAVTPPFTEPGWMVPPVLRITPLPMKPAEAVVLPPARMPPMLTFTLPVPVADPVMFWASSQPLLTLVPPL